MAVMIDPGAPVRQNNNIRQATVNNKPLDTNVKGRQLGPAAQMEKSRTMAFLSTSQANAAMAQLGKSINIFA